MLRVELDTSEPKASSLEWLHTARTSLRATGAINWPRRKRSEIIGVLTFEDEIIVESACFFTVVFWVLCILRRGDAEYSSLRRADNPL